MSSKSPPTVPWDEPTGWPTDARRDRLIGDWHLYQRTGGHRTSTDDLITAWYAVHRTVEPPQRYLDLGCGIGSVLLMVAHRLTPPICDGIEAQPQSFAMATRTLSELPSHASAITVRHGDFRAADFENGYDLVTGSPPYFPLDAGVLPSDPQRRACRFEARGGVEDYVRTAATTLNSAGRLYLVFQTQAADRALCAARPAGLHLTGQADFIMRRDREAPFLSVLELRNTPVDTPHRTRIVIREPDGGLSPEYAAIRAELGVG